MGISISNHIRLAIMSELEDLAEEFGVTNTSDLDLFDIENAINTVLVDTSWVPSDESWEAAQALADDFDNVTIGEVV